MSGSRPVPDTGARRSLDATDLRFLDYLIAKAIESCIESRRKVAQPGTRHAT